MKKIFALAFLVLSINVFALELDGIKFDDKVKIGNSELTLNGVGIRKATIFKVKVYYGGLYLEQKTSDSNAILSSTSAKQIVMNFVHDVDANKLKSGFSEGVEKNTKNIESIKSSLDKLNNTITDVVKGDKIVISFYNDGVAINVKGKTYEKFANAEFSKVLLSIWFNNPADEGLRSGLLGAKN